MRELKLIVCLLFFASSGFAVTPKTVFQKAETLYKANNFDRALSEYEKLTKKNYVGKDLFYNIGNCYFKLGQLGYAIAYYEKAMNFDPADKDIIANLRLANSKTEDKINNEENGLSGWFNRFTHAMSPDSWSIYGILLWIFAFLTFFLVNKKIIKRSFQLASWLAIIIGICFMTFGYFEYLTFSSHSKAVITQGMVQVKASPSENAKNLYILHEGAKINLHQIRESWIEISIDNDNYGWVLKTEAEII